MSSVAPKDDAPAHQKNNHVDYVIQFNFSNTGKLSAWMESSGSNSPDPDQAISQLESLLRKLSEVGLQTEVREGDESTVLVFVRASRKKHLRHAVYQSR